MTRFAALILALSFAVCGAFGATGYSVTGDVTFENFFARERVREGYLPFQPIVTETHQFSLSVSNDCWLMRVTPSFAAVYAYKEASFDGTSLYYVDKLGSAGNQAATGQNVATARICDNQRVVYDGFAHEMGPVWLMFGSAVFWAGTTNSLVEPATIMGLFEIQEFYKKPFTVRAHWALQNDFPRLPAYVAYLDDGMIKTDPEFPEYQRKPPFDKGFTNTVFQVLSFTNINGVKLPLAGQLDTFRPEPRGRRPELLHYTQYRMTLKTWSTTPEPMSFRPVLPGLTLISDSRVYSKVRGHVYVSSDWRSIEQVTNSVAYRDKLELYRRISGTSGNRPSH